MMSGRQPLVCQLSKLREEQEQVLLHIGHVIAKCQGLLGDGLLRNKATVRRAAMVVTTLGLASSEPLAV